MRVIAGTAKGHRLTTPPGRGTRPTSERVREALFSAVGGELAGARVCDLFAGSGALGIEALSRGAERAVFVERSSRAVAAIEDNLARTGLAAHATVHRRDVVGFCRAPSEGPFDLVLADPPYDESLERVYARLDELREAGALVEDVTVVIERDRRDPLAAVPPDWLAPPSPRAYGDTVVLILRARAETGATGP